MIDIREAILAILDYTKNYSFADYERDMKTRHAVERNFEIIGETAARVPNNFKEQHSHIE
jgi:uncharacterized protein with HEPN domain